MIARVLIVCISVISQLRVHDGRKDDDLRHIETNCSRVLATEGRYSIDVQTAFPVCGGTESLSAGDVI